MGLYAADSLVVKVKNPKNREPVDTDHNVSSTADKWFEKKFGIKYRSNSLFVTGNLGTAEEYGETVAIFPIGEFSFCWSPKVSDFTYSLIKGSELTDGFDELEEVTRHMDLADYTSTNLIAAIDSGNEIMIHCPAGFYAVTVDNSEFTNLLKGIVNPNIFNEMDYLQDRIDYYDSQVEDNLRIIEALTKVMSMPIRTEKQRVAIMQFLNKNKIPESYKYVYPGAAEIAITSYHNIIDDLHSAISKAKLKLSKLKKAK